MTPASYRVAFSDAETGTCKQHLVYEIEAFIVIEIS